MEVDFRTITIRKAIITLEQDEALALIQILKYVSHRVKCHPYSGAKCCNINLIENLLEKL